MDTLEQEAKALTDVRGTTDQQAWPRVYCILFYLVKIEAQPFDVSEV